MSKYIFYDHVNSSWHIECSWLLSKQTAPLVNPYVTNSTFMASHLNDRLAETEQKLQHTNNGSWTLMMRNISCNKMWQYTMHYLNAGIRLRSLCFPPGNTVPHGGQTERQQLHEMGLRVQP